MKKCTFCNKDTKNVYQSERFEKDFCSLECYESFAKKIDERWNDNTSKIPPKQTNKKD